VLDLDDLVGSSKCLGVAKEIAISADRALGWLADPEAKGIIERNLDYFETLFLPGRSFTRPADFNR